MISPNGRNGGSSHPSSPSYVHSSISEGLAPLLTPTIAGS